MKKRRVIAVSVLIFAGLIGVRDLYMTLEPHVEVLTSYTDLLHQSAQQKSVHLLQ